MLDELSPLKQLPSMLAPHQALVLDGMNHAVDIAYFSYKRLQTTLHGINTEILEQQDALTPAYLDAWAFVDAIDRFRALLSHFPKGGILSRVEAHDTFLSSTEDLRVLRNVADHVHKRIDHLVSKKGSALGQLSWIAVVESEVSTKFVSNTIRPGFLAIEVHEQILSSPALVPIDFPVGHIHMKAGECLVNLSDVKNALRTVVGCIEEQLADRYRVMGNAYKPCNRDMFMRCELSPGGIAAESVVDGSS